jgi:MFS transporter, putative metabolite:H+ symporter
MMERRTLLFWGGIALVTVGVLMHLPMYILSAPVGYHLCGMDMDTTMIAGIGAITLGTAASWMALIRPEIPGAEVRLSAARLAAPPPQQELTTAHWTLLFTVVVALVIDVMKPATLGFTVPGAMAEYGLTRPQAALLPLSGLTGTMLGSFIWGILADRTGRRGAILAAAIMFIGTSICGTMTTYNGNLLMCMMMGLSAGGMLPIAYTLLAETIPAKHRGWCVVLIGGAGVSGGFLAASAAATFIEPVLSWRALWFLGLPTGVILMMLNHFIPESPGFLLLRGEVEEAERIMLRYRMPPPAPRRTPAQGASDWRALASWMTVALLASSLVWGLVNHGLLLWLPADLRSRGLSAAAANGLLANGAMFALPTAAFTAWLYHSVSTKWTLVLMTAIMLAGLIGFPMLPAKLTAGDTLPLVLVTLLLVGTSGVIAALLPFSAESYAIHVRGRATGLVAGATKAGGIAAQLLTISALVPALVTIAWGLMIPTILGAILIGRFGLETRHRDLDTSGGLQAQGAD